MIKKIALALLLITVFSCKNEKTETSNKLEETIKEDKKEPKKELEFVVRLKTNKQDDFKIVMNNVVVDEFQKKNIQVIEKVLPSTDMETITASFGENNISNNLYFSLGNKEVKEVEIESISITYGINSIEISTSNLTESLSFNKYVVFDENSGKLITKKIDGKHNPRITVKKPVLKQLIY